MNERMHVALLEPLSLWSGCGNKIGQPRPLPGMLYHSRSPIHDLGVDPGHRAICQAGHGGQEKGRWQVWASEPGPPAASVQGLKEMSGPIGSRCRANGGAKAQGTRCAEVADEPWRVSPRRPAAEAEPRSPPPERTPPKAAPRMAAMAPPPLSVALSSRSLQLGYKTSTRYAGMICVQIKTHSAGGRADPGAPPSSLLRGPRPLGG